MSRFRVLYYVILEQSSWIICNKMCLIFVDAAMTRSNSLNESLQDLMIIPDIADYQAVLWLGAVHGGLFLAPGEKMLLNTYNKSLYLVMTRVNLWFFHCWELNLHFRMTFLWPKPSISTFWTVEFLDYQFSFKWPSTWNHDRSVQLGRTSDFVHEVHFWSRL